MGRKSNVVTAKEVGEAYARRLHSDFQNEKMRGPNFNWSKFPDMVKRFSETGVFMSLHYKVKNLKNLKEIAGKAGFNLAKELIKNEQSNHSI